MRAWIARLFGLEVAAVRFGSNNEIRFVRRTTDGTPYIHCYGYVFVEGEREWRWLIQSTDVNSRSTNDE